MYKKCETPLLLNVWKHIGKNILEKAKERKLWQIKI